ncbi:HAMP domain-containing histidine kinase [Micromonospora peucetia]|uniref:histidine kinase n=1 Tax=Micromonospora peucetia TaxID=47871 RepID=A0A1C6TZS7_9ACTN|nr:ATP-binding protein [Micromonospora peucetia]MCX4385809.1 HAMP domain-containing histidine kinase [Micromonospora peucetia]WSA35538.1 HAMP domain-containing histidine kinase [Micromonospora peucetia]SCL47284.1 Signal transduction histidine kinase [Micromonospora peucetia]
MAVGVLGVSGGLAVGGLVLLAVLGWALQRAVDTEAFRTADAVALLAAEEVLPDPLPVAGGQVRVQVIDAAGRVRAASIDADRLVPMVSPKRIDAGARQRLTVSGERVGLAGPVRVVAVPAGTAADPRTVLVARSLADVRHSAHVVRTILLVSFPLLVAVLAAVAWRVVGATLRPVEGLRRGAEEITGRDGGGRLPVPASQDEIHRLAVTLNGMLGRLESARDRQRAFVADAAHELRSPLTNIRTELEVARRLADRTDWTAVSANLLADTERLGRLVDDLLLLARLDEGPPARATGPVELGALLAAVAARYPSPPVRLDAPTVPLWTEGDSDELRRILTNLVDNAVRHAHGEVVLAVGPPTGRGKSDGSGVGATAYHLVTVTDDGPGVPVADRERVFGRFTRLDDARARDDGGAGLGLAIVRELVRRAGGGIDLADAHPGRAGGPGLRVRLLLPALPDPERP